MKSAIMTSRTRCEKYSDRSMIPADYLYCDRRFISGREVQRQVVSALFGCIAGESGVARDVLQRSCDLSVTDLDPRLQIRCGFAEEILSCQSIGIY